MPILETLPKNMEYLSKPNQSMLRHLLFIGNLRDRCESEFYMRDDMIIYSKEFSSFPSVYDIQHIAGQKYGSTLEFLLGRILEEGGESANVLLLDIANDAHESLNQDINFFLSRMQHSSPMDVYESFKNWCYGISHPVVGFSDWEKRVFPKWEKSKINIDTPKDTLEAYARTRQGKEYKMLEEFDNDHIEEQQKWELGHAIYLEMAEFEYFFSLSALEVEVDDIIMAAEVNTTNEGFLSDIEWIYEELEGGMNTLRKMVKDEYNTVLYRYKALEWAYKTITSRTTEEAFREEWTYHVEQWLENQLTNEKFNNYVDGEIYLDDGVLTYNISQDAWGFGKRPSSISYGVDTWREVIDSVRIINKPKGEYYELKDGTRVKYSEYQWKDQMLPLFELISNYSRAYAWHDGEIIDVNPDMEDLLIFDDEYHLKGIYPIGKKDWILHIGCSAILLSQLKDAYKSYYSNPNQKVLF